MKKSIIIALSLTAILTSCKKDETNEFTQTDVSGTTILKGNVGKPIITPDGNGSAFISSRVPAVGVSVSVKVNKNSLYPNSNAQGADIYSGVTDVNGNYAISVKSNAQGVNAQITIDGFTGTQDTVINGVTKTGLYASYTGLSTTRQLFMGQNSLLDYYMTANVVSANPNTIMKIGTAKVTGSVGVTIFKEVMTGTLSTITTTVEALANHKVYLNFNKDPNTIATKLYEVTTDASGRYSFDLSTISATTTAFPDQDATVWVNDFATTQDTVFVGSKGRKTGHKGVFSRQTITETEVLNNHIRNANNFNYSSFTQD